MPHAELAALSYYSGSYSSNKINRWNMFLFAKTIQVHCKYVQDGMGAQRRGV